MLLCCCIIYNSKVTCNKIYCVCTVFLGFSILLCAPNLQESCKAQYTCNRIYCVCTVFLGFSFSSWNGFQIYQLSKTNRTEAATTYHQQLPIATVEPIYNRHLWGTMFWPLYMRRWLLLRGCFVHKLFLGPAWMPGRFIAIGLYSEVHVVVN